MIILYNLLYIIFLIFYLPIFIVKKKYHKNFSMRLGVFSDDIINKLKDKDVIWIHAVSVGEVNSAIPIIEGLRKLHPDKLLVISTVTKTGNQTAEKISKDDELVIYLPLDISFIVKKVIHFINPKVFIIVETEIWPNLIFALSNKNIPIALVNGRISPSSYRGYKIVRFLIKPVLEKINLFCMQTKQDALRIISLGAEPDNVKITGNTKFDIETNFKSIEKDIDNLADKLKLKEDDQVLIAGSTHYSEEKILFSCYSKLLINKPNLKMIVAPRHIDRIKKIEKQAEAFGFKPIKFTELITHHPHKQDTKLIIVDVMGKLKTLYALATVVFIGGSFAKIGGHNMIEAASFSKAIIFGPYVYNFQNIAENLINNNAAYKVNDEKELYDKINQLLLHHKEREQLGENAHKAIEDSRGAAKKNLKFINDLMI